MTALLRRIDPLKLLYALTLIWLALFLVLPLGRVLLQSVDLLFTSGEPLPDGLLRLTARLTGRSLLLAGLTTLISLFFAIVLAVFATKVEIPGRPLFQVLLVLPLVTPPFISGFATILLLGKTGVITQLLGLKSFSIYGLNGLVITHALHFIPYAFLVISAGLKAVPRQLEEAALGMGSRFLGVMTKVTLPYVMPHILMGGMLVFLASFGDVGAAVLLGGSYQVLPSEIYTSFITSRDDRIPLILSAWIILLSVGMVWVVRRLMARTEIKHAFRTTAHIYREPHLKVIATAVCIGGALLLFLPYAMIAIASLGTIWGVEIFPTAYTLKHYASLWKDIRPMTNSVKLVAIAAPITVVMAVLVGQIGRSFKWGGLLDYFVQLPFVVPGIVLGVGFIRAYNGVELFGVELLGGAFPLVAAFTIRRLAHTTRATGAAFARVDRRVEEASQSLGASPWRTFWRVTLPQLRPALVAATILALVKIITELSVTLMVQPPNLPTMSTFIFYYVMDGYIGKAAAMSMLLLAVVAVGTALANQIQRERG